MSFTCPVRPLVPFALSAQKRKHNLIVCKENIKSNTNVEENSSHSSDIAYSQILIACELLVILFTNIIALAFADN